MKWLNLSIVLTLVAAGGLMLALDTSVIPMWMSLGGAFVGFASGIGLGYLFDRKNMLPQ